MLFILFNSFQSFFSSVEKLSKSQQILVIIGENSSTDKTRNILENYKNKNFEFIFLKTDSLKFLIVDEAEEMRATGFKEQLQNIFHSLPEDIQIALFSATLPDYAFDDIKLFIKQFGL